MPRPGLWETLLYIFRTVPVSIIRSFSLYTQQRYMSYRFADCLRAGSGWNWVPSWSCSRAVSITCMTYAIAVCTVKNSWWWTEEMSETCRISLQNKFENLVHLVGYYKKFVTMQGHMNVKICRHVKYSLFLLRFNETWGHNSVSPRALMTCRVRRLHFPLSWLVIHKLHARHQVSLVAEPWQGCLLMSRYQITPNVLP